MSIRVSKKVVCDEFMEHIKQYELINGTQEVNGIRALARTFAGTRYQLDDKASMPLYHRCFTYACILRGFRQMPDDFNEDNPYDPDGLYPGDPNIKKKLKAMEKRAEQMVLEIIERNNT